MWMKVATAGAVGAIIVGAGVAALASNVTSGSSPASPAATPASNLDALVSTGAPDAAKALGRHGLGVMRRLEHGEWVSRAGGKDVTHDAIRGTVTSVGATSIAVQAKDGFALRFVVDSHTTVVLREKGKGSRHKSTIGNIKSGDNVLVEGIKSGSALDAKHVLDVGH
jgi:hypothetical protein